LGCGSGRVSGQGGSNGDGEGSRLGGFCGAGSGLTGMVSGGASGKVSGMERLWHNAEFCRPQTLPRWQSGLDRRRPTGKPQSRG
jgi:hypothetical protein